MKRHRTDFSTLPCRSIDGADNRALLEAHRLQVPIVYYVGTRRGWFHPMYPTYVTENLHEERRVLLRRVVGLRWDHLGRWKMSLSGVTRSSNGVSVYISGGFEESCSRHTTTAARSAR